MKCNTISLRDYIGSILIEEGKNHSKVCVLDSDLAKSTSTNDFAEIFPERFYELGIAEQSAMGVATGLSLEGFVPFYVNFAIFVTGTAWTQLRQLCYSKSNVKIVGTHPGIDNGPDGASHHANEDIAISRVIPNLIILTPDNLEDLRMAIRKAISVKGPVYIRVSRDPIPQVKIQKKPFIIGKAEMIIDEGNDLALIYEGSAFNTAWESCKYLRNKGLKLKLINIRSIKPIDRKLITDIAKDVKGIITIENHSICGGLGSAVSEVLVQEGINTKIKYVGIEDVFTESGKTDDLKLKYGLSPEGVYTKVLELTK